MVECLIIGIMVDMVEDMLLHSNMAVDMAGGMARPRNNMGVTRNSRALFMSSSHTKTVGEVAAAAHSVQVY